MNVEADEASISRLLESRDLGLDALLTAWHKPEKIAKKELNAVHGSAQHLRREGDEGSVAEDALGADDGIDGIPSLVDELSYGNKLLAGYTVNGLGEIRATHVLSSKAYSILLVRVEVGLLEALDPGFGFDDRSTNIREVIDDFLETGRIISLIAIKSRPCCLFLTR